MTQNTQNNIEKKSIFSLRKIIIIFLSLVIISLFGLLFFELKSQISFLKDKISIFDTQNSTNSEFDNNNDQSNDVNNLQNNADIITDDYIENIEETEEMDHHHVHNNKCNSYAELLIYLFNIQKRVLQGEPFNRELLSLEIHYNSDSVINGLLKNIRNHSEAGIANVNNLQSEFKSIENDLILAYWIENHQKNWKSQVRKILSKLVFIKKTGQRAIRSGGIEMIIQNVNEALESNDLDAAIGYLSKVEGDAPKKIISIWLEHVHNYIDINNSLRKLIDYVISQQHCTNNNINKKSK
jgi:hypothetical protein